MIIFLNAPTSSGKTVISKEIQKVVRPCMISIGVDSFIDMRPNFLCGVEENALDGFRFIIEK